MIGYVAINSRVFLVLMFSFFLMHNVTVQVCLILYTFPAEV